MGLSYCNQFQISKVMEWRLLLNKMEFSCSKRDCVRFWPLCGDNVLVSLAPPGVLVQPKPDVTTQTGLDTLLSLCRFAPCLVIPYASASKTSGGTQGCVACGGGGENIITLQCQLLLLSSSDPWATINYPIYAIITFSSGTQLWETNKWADLEKNAFTLKDPEGLKGTI